MRHVLRPAPIVALLLACAGGEPASDRMPDLVLVDVTVVDGTGAAPRPGQTIEVTDRRISAIRPTVPEDSATLDVAGSFVLPGLIDAHVHLPDDADPLDVALDSLLDRGITSAREMACCAPDYRDFYARADTTELPRLYWSAFWAGRPFLRDDQRLRDRYAEEEHVPWLLHVTDTTDVEAELRGARSAGATGLKIYSNLEPSTVAALVGAGRDAGFEVWSHAVVFPTRPSEVVEAGVDVISHAAFFVWEVPEEIPATYNGGHLWNAFGPPAPYASVPPDHPEVVGVLEDMAGRGTILDPTISVMTGLDEESRTWAVELTRLAHETGVPIAVGTDFALFFDEVEALVREVGLTPLEAIHSATSVGAAAIGVEDDLGTIEVGKVADLAVYPADPSRDVSALRRPSHVVRGGEVVRRSGAAEARHFPPDDDLRANVGPPESDLQEALREPHRVLLRRASEGREGRR